VLLKVCVCLVVPYAFSSQIWNGRIKLSLDGTQIFKGVVQEIILELCKLNGLGESQFTNRAGCEALLWKGGFVWRRKAINDMRDSIKVFQLTGVEQFDFVMLPVPVRRGVAGRFLGRGTNGPGNGRKLPHAFPPIRTPTLHHRHG
jgi:hypothetical protein